MESAYRWEEDADYLRSPEGQGYLRRLSNRIREIQAQPNTGLWESGAAKTIDSTPLSLTA
jgi:hypothetical protein